MVPFWLTLQLLCVEENCVEMCVCVRACVCHSCHDEGRQASVLLRHPELQAPEDMLNEQEVEWTHEHMCERVIECMCK